MKYSDLGRTGISVSRICLGGNVALDPSVIDAIEAVHEGIPDPAP